MIITQLLLTRVPIAAMLFLIKLFEQNSKTEIIFIF